MVPDIKVTKPPSEVSNVTAHFLHCGQLYGLVGSLGPSQVTYTKSTPVSNIEGVKEL